MRNRMISLVAGSAAVGWASGALYPHTMAPRGAVLGASLALGTLLINAVSARHYREGEGPSWRTVFTTAVFVGLLAGCAIMLYQSLTFNRYESVLGFAPEPTPRGWPVLCVCVGYSVAMHALYNFRWRLHVLVYLTPWLVAVGGLGAAVARDFYLHGLDDPASSLLIGLGTGLPFALGWGLVGAFADPAFTLARWRKLVARGHALVIVD